MRDNGIGVDPDQARRIFGIFSRARPRGRGRGIGLAVCRRIVEAHGGRIWVEAAEGGGSAFRFTLPLAPQGLTPHHRRAARCARTSRTSWSVCVAGTTCAEGERSAPLP